MSYCPLVERLGLDENFVDVTELVESRRRNTDISELSFVGHIYKHDGEEITQTYTQNTDDITLWVMLMSQCR